MEKIKLPNRKRKALISLFKSCSVQEAAIQSGVGVRTLYRWMTQPDFKNAIREVEEESLQHATKQFLGQLGTSIETICEIRDDIDASHGVRLKAAHSVIDYSIRLYELTDIAERISNLEEIFYDIDE